MLYTDASVTKHVHIFSSCEKSDNFHYYVVIIEAVNAEMIAQTLVKLSILIVCFHCANNTFGLTKL